VRSRLAPSPTGALHVGNARTFLLTWLHVRAAGGTLLLRNDDLDGPRAKRGAEREAQEDLAWLGLDWDASEGVLVQSERGAVYAAAARRLADAGLAYPCVCTRSEVESAASAPHGLEGPRYPGTCRGRWASLDEAAHATGRPAALRFVAPAAPVAFTDLFVGAQVVDVAQETGDFVVFRGNGTAAYQLATVVDDAASGVDLVIRGADLLPSTARQRLLQQALGLPSPSWLHVPLVVGPDGRRLAKRHGDTTLRALRQAGWTPAGVVGFLAWTAGLADRRERLLPRELLSRHDLARVPREPVVLDAAGLGAPR
jgi:glutamyl-tRNA synthetase